MPGTAQGSQDTKFEGIEKIFNSRTVRGRANTAMATYAVIGVGTLAYFAFRPKKAKE